MIGSNAQESILKAADELFLESGFKSVSIDRICKNAGVSRKTFYVYFEDKYALVVALLEHIQRPIFEQFDRIMASDRPFPAKLSETLNLKYEMSKRMSLAFISDLMHSPEQSVKVYFERLMEESKVLVRDFFKQSQEKGEVRSDIDIEIILFFLYHFQGLIQNDSFLALFPNTETMMRQSVSLYFEGIINR